MLVTSLPFSSRKRKGDLGQIDRLETNQPTDNCKQTEDNFYCSQSAKQVYVLLCESPLSGQLHTDIDM